MKPKGMLITNRLSMAKYSSTCVSRAIFHSLKLLNFKKLRPEQAEALGSFLQEKDVFVSVRCIFVYAREFSTCHGKSTTVQTVILGPPKYRPSCKTI